MVHGLTALFPLPAVIVSGDGKIVEANAPMADLLHSTARALLGRELLALVLDPEEKVRNYLRVCAGSRQLMPGKLSWRLNDAETMDLRCDGAAIEPAQGDNPALILLRCRLRVEANSHFTLLNEKIAELSAEVRARKQIQAQLEQAITAREGFMAAISHELRNPINALQLTIQGVIRNLNGSRAPMDSAQLAARMTRAATQVTRLVKLVENVLDASRLSAGRIELQVEDFDAAALAREMVDQFKEKANAPEIILSVPPSIPIRTDRTRLEQVITNLLSNAEKYGMGRPIELSWDVYNSGVRITVTDHGIGIAHEDQSRIFDRFERAVVGRQYVGFGLGLWLARQLVEAMGGRISVKSALGAGATFLVELPYSGYTAEQAVDVP